MSQVFKYLLHAIAVVVVAKLLLKERISNQELLIVGVVAILACVVLQQFQLSDILNYLIGALAVVLVVRYQLESRVETRELATLGVFVIIINFLLNYFGY